MEIGRLIFDLIIAIIRAFILGHNYLIAAIIIKVFREGYMWLIAASDDWIDLVCLTILISMPISITLFFATWCTNFAAI